MFKRIIGKKELLFCWVFPSIKFDHEELERYKQARGIYIEDDWERVKSIFSQDDSGNLHPELVRAFSLFQMGLFVGAVIGGTLASKKKMDEFMDQNDGSKFLNKKDALSQLSQRSTLGFLSGAFKFAPRFGIFIGGYSLFCSCLEAYRNKCGIIENTIGGAGIGALFKFHYGVRGMISGGTVGAVLGTIYGVLAAGLAKLFQKDQLEIKYAQYAVSKYRQDLAHKKFNDLLTPEQEEVEPFSNYLTQHVPDPLNALQDKENSEKTDESSTEKQKIKKEV